MSSLITNTSAMNALATLRNVNSNLATTQDRIGTGLKISSAKDNAAYFSISESMKGDSNMYAAIDEGLTLTKNSLSTARLGAEAFQELAEQFVERIGFAQTGKQTVEEVQKELDGIVKQMKTTIQQSTFNGDDFVNAANAGAITANGKGVSANGVVADATATPPVEAVDTRAFVETKEVDISRDIVTGISRAGDGFAATTMSIKQVDLTALLQDFTNLAANFKDNAADTTALTADGKIIGGGSDTDVADADKPGITIELDPDVTPETGIDATDPAAIAVTTKGAEYLKAVLKAAENTFGDAVDASTSLGLSEKSIERQQDFLKKITATIDTGVGAMVDADMEEEAARLQALQVQQQLATQSLSIANEGPQNLLSLFR